MTMSIISILLCLACLGIGWLGRWLYGKIKLTSVEQKAIRLNQEAIKEAEEGMVTTFASVDDFKKHMYEL